MGRILDRNGSKGFSQLTLSQRYADVTKRSVGSRNVCYAPSTNRVGKNLRLRNVAWIHADPVFGHYVGRYPATYLIGPDGVILFGGGVTRPAALQQALMKAGLWPKP